MLLADFQEVTAGIARWEDWCAAWCARAAVHERLGRDALADGCGLTAAEHLSRAGVYYHFAKFLFVQDQEQMRAAHMKAVACREAALPFLRPPGERVSIPFKDGFENTVADYMFGSTFNFNDMSGVIANEPPVVKQTLPTLVPRVNQAGISARRNATSSNEP